LHILAIIEFSDMSDTTQRQAPDGPSDKGSSNASTPAAASNRLTYSLRTLFFAVTLVAACCGALVYNFGLGIAICIILALALFRFVVRAHTGSIFPGSGTELKIMAFVVLLALCCPIALFAACFSAGVGLYDMGADPRWGIDLAWMLGIVAALQAAELIYALVLRQKK
jgi:hypothetical protein